MQNEPAIAAYQRAVLPTALATVRGFALTPPDHLRADVIVRLMCDMSFSAQALREGFGTDAADAVIAVASDILASDSDGFVVTDLGRPFMRTIAARFDTYLGRGAVPFAGGVNRLSAVLL